MSKQQQLKRVERLVKKYKKVLHLTGWDITFEVFDCGVLESAAEVMVLPAYMSAHIKVDGNAFKPMNNIDHIICHELCHCLTEPMFRAYIDMLNGKFTSPDTVNDMRETLTEQISRLVRDA